MIKKILMFIDAMFIGFCMLPILDYSMRLGPVLTPMFIIAVGLAVWSFVHDIQLKMQAKKTPKRTLR